MKYVVFSNDTFAIIPDSCSHDSVVKDKTNVVSAGFCWLESYRNEYDDIRFRACCGGESITLGVKSRGGRRCGSTRILHEIIDKE